MHFTAHYEYFRNNKLDAPDFFNYGPFFAQDGSRQSVTLPFKQNLSAERLVDRSSVTGTSSSATTRASARNWNKRHRPLCRTPLSLG
jgi:hypothetical protein